MQEWLDAHPRVHHVFIPKGACWLNLQEGWWRGAPFGSRHEAFAGQTFADGEEIDNITIPPPRSSIIERNPGSGVALPDHTVGFVAVWCTAFEERTPGARATDGRGRSAEHFSWWMPAILHRFDGDAGRSPSPA